MDIPIPAVLVELEISQKKLTANLSYYYQNSDNLTEMKIP
tara:strand:- start:2215 stop:2334 length:120 start_codon:yes stop_codon:yes gene_type:complete